MNISNPYLSKSFILTIILTIIIVIQTPKIVYGHALPSSYSIEPDSLIDINHIPSQLTITFSERPDPNFSYIRILNSNSERVDNDDFKITGENGRQATVTLNRDKLSNGVYTVAWSTLSLDDGHIAKGAYVFVIGNSRVDHISDDKTNLRAQTSYGSTIYDALLKWPLIVAQTASVGVTLSHIILGKSISANSRLIKRLILILIMSSITIIIFTIVSVFLQASNLASQSQYNIITVLQTLIFNLPIGTVFIIRTTTSVAVISLLAVYYRQIARSKSSNYLYLIAVLTAGAVNIISNSIFSHNSISSIAITADWLHFMGVAAWIGGLFYLSSILIPMLKDKMKEEVYSYDLSLAILRFSQITIISLGIIGVTGIYMAYIHLNSLDSLFNTQYGINLVIKLFTALPMVLLGAYNQMIIYKHIISIARARKVSEGYIISNDNSNKNDSNSSDYNIVKLHRSVKIESLIGITVLFAAALLTVTAPPLHSHQSSIMQGNDGYHQEAIVNGIRITLDILPFRVGVNTFIVTLHDATSNNPIQNAKYVFLSFTNKDTAVGPIVATLDNDRIHGDKYLTTGGYLSQYGNWNIDVIVQRIDAYDINHSFEVIINPTMNNISNNMNKDTGLYAQSTLTYLAIALAVIVASMSTFLINRSNKQLREARYRLKYNL